MKREESPFDFLEDVSNLHKTPVHHMRGYVPPPVEYTDEELTEQAAVFETQRQKAVADEHVMTLDEERRQLNDDPHNFVRSRIKQQVQDVVWLDMLREQMHAKSAEEEVDDRCIICTLPYGHCSHTRDEPAQAEEQYSRKSTKMDAVDRELDEMLGVMGGSLVLDTHAESTEGVDLDTMRWVDLQPALSDKIGATYMALSTPPPRGWHSSTYMEHLKLLLVFGGFRWRGDQVPQPFGVVPKEEELEFLSCMYRFDVITGAWYMSNTGADNKAPHPNGRYGHCAAAVDEHRMLVYGGRATRGRYLSDTWMYDAHKDQWTLIEPNSASPPPSPRSFASCVSARGKVYLFGGTDGVENFGDLWVFNSAPGVMRWERSIAVGIPPSPRYGHELVLLNEPGMESQSEHMICLVGGCCVSPQSEVFGTAATTEETKRMLDLGKTLEGRYVNEGEVSMLGGQYLQSVTQTADGVGGGSLRDIYQQAAGITSQIFEAETLTRQAEKDLVQAHNIMEASRSLKKKKARHPHTNADAFFLDINDMMWKPQVYPPISGEQPKARMHFGATCVGGYLLVMGGSHPTSLSNKCVDEDHTRIYAMDLRSKVWMQCAPRDSSEYLELPVQIAESDVLRAKARTQLETDRGRALGARNGMTVELAEAQAVQKVCQWRYNLLHAEMENMTQPPAPRWGTSLARYGARVYMFSGWNARRVEKSGNFYVLDLEQEHERRRREDDEFHTKLEKDRQNEDARNAGANMQSAYELQQLIRAEKVNEAKERRKMVVEDVLSCVPPLMRPSPVRLTKRNQHSMWLEWDRVTENTVGHPMAAGEVKYNLYMINRYTHFALEDRVLSMPKAAIAAIEAEERGAEDDDGDMSVLTNDTTPTKGRKGGGSVSSHSKAGTHKKTEEDYADYRGEGFPGEVVGISKKGFDIAFDDGTFEANVHRSRMKLERARGFQEEEEMELPEGMSLAQFDELKEAQREVKAARDALTMYQKDAYLINESMAYATKKRIKRKHEVRKVQMVKLQNFVGRSNMILPFDISNENLLKKLGDPAAVAAAAAAVAARNAKQNAAAQEEVAANDDNDDSDSDSDAEIEEDEEERQARKLQELFDNGYDRKQYLANLREQTGKEVTILVHSDWELVYSGCDTHAEVSGLVPDEVLAHDPGLQVPVLFCLQVCGADFPAYEHSQLSEVSEFRTSVDRLAKRENTQDSSDLLPIGDGGAGDDKSTGTASTARTPVPAGLLKKKEKDSFTATIRGKEVVFELYKDYAFGLAQGDYYM